MIPRALEGILLAVIALVLMGCASTDPRSTSGYGRYELGPVTVWILDEGTVNLACQLRRAKPLKRYQGCYIENGRTIVSTQDVHVLLHELRHFFEPEWKHL